jgi:hypothetical protein
MLKFLRYEEVNGSEDRDDTMLIARLEREPLEKSSLPVRSSPIILVPQEDTESNVEFQSRGGRGALRYTERALV